MGNNQDSKGSDRKSSIFLSKKIEQSNYKQINAVYLDECQFPESGIITVGIEQLDLENYSVDGSVLNSYFSPSSKILCSALQFSSQNQPNSLLLGCEDNYLYVLESKTLKLNKKFRIILTPSDLVIPTFDIKYQDLSYFEKFTIEAIIAPFEDSFFLGLSNGFIKQYEIYKGDCIRIYNPIHMEYQNEQQNKMLSISVENLIIPGIDSLNYSHQKEIIFSNHKRIFTNGYNRTFTLEETPILSYQLKGVDHKRITVEGSILKSKVLENRNIYIILTSINSQAYIFDFIKGVCLLKFNCDVMKDPQNLQQISTFALYEFDINHRFQSASFVFNNPEFGKELIDGDILFFIGANGSILISKLKFENDRGALAWTPLKYMNAILEKGEKQKRRFQKQFTALEYIKSRDKICFCDSESTVYWVDNIMRLVHIN